MVAQTEETDMAYATDIRMDHHGLRDRVAALHTAFVEARAQRRVFRRTLEELRMLSDRELADLGIAAADIPGIAREAAYGTK